MYECACVYYIYILSYSILFIIILNYREKDKIKELKVKKENLKNILSEKLAKSNEKNVMISGDKSIDYGYIVEIMTLVKESGASSLDIDTTLNK